MSTVPVVEIDSADFTAYIRDKTIVLRLQQLDFTLVDPPSIPVLGEPVTVDEPPWAGTLTSIATTEYEDTLFVAVTATNLDEIEEDDAPFGVSDEPDGVDTFGYDWDSFQLRLARVDNADELRGSVTIYEPGILPGHIVEITNGNVSWVQEPLLVQEVTVTWLRDDVAVYELQFGSDEPPTLSAENKRPLHPYEELPSVDASCGGMVSLVSGTYPPNNSATTSADLVWYYEKPGTPAPDTPGAHVGAWNFPSYGTGGSPDYAGDSASNTARCMVVGAGTLEIETATWAGAGAGVRGLIAVLRHATPGGDFDDETQTGDTGDTFTFVIDTHGDTKCVHWVDVQDDAALSGGKWGIAGATWDLDTGPVRSPQPTQRIDEYPSGDDAGEDLQTNYPYLNGSLIVDVDGIRVIPDTTSPITGVFTLPIDTTGRRVSVTYQAATSVATGATNTYTAPTGVTYPSHVLLGSGGTGAGTKVLYDDETWGSPGSVAAEDVSITDTGGYFTGTDVEAALQELGADVAAAVAGHWEVVVSGTAPPVAVSNPADDDWVYAFVPD